jgi:hypothetical protein
MITQRSFIASFVCAATLCGGMLLAHSQATHPPAPVVNIGTRHGNLRSAQQDIVSAYQKINAAQRDNDDQLGGHAQHAKDLLAQADAELRQAANVSNAEGK